MFIFTLLDIIVPFSWHAFSPQSIHYFPVVNIIFYLVHWSSTQMEPFLLSWYASLISLCILFNSVDMHVHHRVALSKTKHEVLKFNHFEKKCYNGTYWKHEHLCTIFSSYTVLPAKSDSDVMFSLQSYQGFRIATALLAKSDSGVMFCLQSYMYQRHIIDRLIVYLSYPQDIINTRDLSIRVNSSWMYKLFFI